jgi:membrane-associated PAP2 superfamily phosphatase
LALIISALVILAVGEFTNIDLIIEDYYYDPILKTFPWKNTWFAKDLMHVYVKNVILACGVSLYLFLLIDLCKPWKWITKVCRFKFRFVAIASVLIPLSVSWVKARSVLHCPWDIVRYNGTAPFLKLLDHVPAGMAHGACFPAGHATSGLWLASLCIFWLPHDAKKATYVFAGGLSIGLILGWVQQMRGAHFLFHTLWSAWIASFIILAMLQFSYTVLYQENNNPSKKPEN